MLWLVFQVRLHCFILCNIKSWWCILPSFIHSAFTEWLIIYWVSHAKCFIYQTIVPVFKIIYKFSGETNIYITNHKAQWTVVLTYNCGQNRSQLVFVMNNDENQLSSLNFFSLSWQLRQCLELLLKQTKNHELYYTEFVYLQDNMDSWLCFCYFLRADRISLKFSCNDF